MNAADAQVDHIHSMIIVRHGHVIAEGYWAPFTADRHQMMYSLSKSFTSTAVGLAISEGKFGLYDPVLKILGDQGPAMPTAYQSAMRVRDLLRMESGQSEATIKSFNGDLCPDIVSWFLSQPVEYKPGSFWYYNSSATHILSAIVQRTTGQTLRDYLQPRLFQPLGITDPTWEKSAKGINLGYSGLRVRTRDIASFGQLVLQGGQWDGRQLVPAAWIKAATSLQASNGGAPDSDWEQGYGYQFWRCRYGNFRGDGAFGQYCIILPAQDAVVALTSGTGDMPRELGLVWSYLLPALGNSPLAADSAADDRLSSRLGSLQIPTVAGDAQPPADVAGKTYEVGLPDGTNKTFLFSGTTLTIGNQGQTVVCPYAPNQWTTAGNAAYSGAWTADHTFVLETQDLNLPFLHTLRLKFMGNEVWMDEEQQPHFDSYAPVLALQGSSVDH